MREGDVSLWNITGSVQTVDHFGTSCVEIVFLVTVWWAWYNQLYGNQLVLPSDCSVHCGIKWMFPTHRFYFTNHVFCCATKPKVVPLWIQGRWWHSLSFISCYVTHISLQYVTMTCYDQAHALASCMTDHYEILAVCAIMNHWCWATSQAHTEHNNEAPKYNTKHIYKQRRWGTKQQRQTAMSQTARALYCHPNCWPVTYFPTTNIAHCLS